MAEGNPLRNEKCPLREGVLYMLANPYASLAAGKGQWLKANFHTHAGTGQGTCGVNGIDDVAAAYKDAGYDILTISNHDLFSDTAEYQQKHDIVLINGFEYSAYPHMLCIGVEGLIEGNHQDAVNKCVEQGGIAVLCHPNWQRKEYWAWSDMLSLQRYTGIEIYNGVIYRLNGSGLATDAWDFLLSNGKMVWGFGNDDFHRWHDLSRAWNVIYAASKNHEDIKAAIKSGSFYVSTGLILREFTIDNGTIKIHASAKNTYVKDNKYIFYGKDGKKLEEQTGEHGFYHVGGDEMYVRVQVVSEHGAMLWTQPVFLE